MLCGRFAAGSFEPQQPQFQQQVLPPTQTLQSSAQPQPAQLSSPQPQDPAPPTNTMTSTPRFCSRHDSSEKRPKGEEASLQGCQKCRLQLHTNHRELALCPQCSDQEGRCMICGTSAVPDPRMAATPVRSMVLNSRPSQQGPRANPSPSAQPQPAPPATSPGQGQGEPPQQVMTAPNYCIRHSTSDKRPKVESRIQECWSCRTRIQTNLAEFALCATCCQKEQRCMVCGHPSVEGVPPLPGKGAPSAAMLDVAAKGTAGVAMQPMLGRGMTGGLLGAASGTLPTPLQR